MNTCHIIYVPMVPKSNSFYLFDSDEYMEEAERANQALFVTRHFGGQHIGHERLDCIMQVTKYAVNQKSHKKLPIAYNYWDVM